MFEHITLTGFADEIDSGLDKQIEVIHKLGMAYIEMRGVNGKELVAYPLNEVRNIKKCLEENGIRLSSIGSPIGKIYITDDFEPHMELYKRTVEIAHIMETPYIRIFSFYIPKGEEPDNYKGKVMAQLGRFVDYANNNNIILLHENEKDIYGDIAVRCKEIMEQFYGKHFRAVFDFANFIQCHQDTLQAYEMLKQYVAYVHVKDALWKDGSVVPAGMGDGHLEDILRMMKKAGYQGFLSLEPHLSEFVGFHNLENGTDKKQIERKLTGEEAFTLAHQSLIKILERL